MSEYNAHLERSSVVKSSVEMGAEHGVSEIDKQKNKGWAHRSNISRSAHDRKRAESISKVVEERREGVAHYQIEEENDHQRDRANNPKAENHGETHPKDRMGDEKESELTKKEEYAKKYGEYWAEDKQEEFLEESELTREQLNW